MGKVVHKNGSVPYKFFDFHSLYMVVEIHIDLEIRTSYFPYLYL
jgi:hypothetical protein